MVYVCAWCGEEIGRDALGEDPERESHGICRECAELYFRGQIPRRPGEGCRRESRAPP